MTCKEFGRYSVADLSVLVQLTRSLESDVAELQKLIAASPQKVRDFLNPLYSWSALYQKPLYELMGALLVYLDVEALISEVSTSPDPHADLFQAMSEIEPGGDQENAQIIMGLSMALSGNFKAISFYSKSLEELTQEVSNGNDQAFFDALLIDRTILTCPPFADRIAFAEYQGDEAFFAQIAKKLRPGSPNKRMKHYSSLRVCLYALETEGCLDTLSEKRAYELFCGELDLYSEDKNGNGFANLNKFIRRWKKERRT